MSDTKIIEAAIEAALTSMEVTKNHLELTPRDRIVMMLAAALPHLHPQPAELAEQQGDSPIDVTDPWRGLYQASRLRAPTEYGDTFHPDIPCWPDDREYALDKLVRAQGFDFHIVAGEFTEAALEDGDDLYWQEMRAWNPEAPEGEWRLAWKGDTEDGPYAWFVRPMALRPEPAALAATGKQQVGEAGCGACVDGYADRPACRVDEESPVQVGEVQGDARAQFEAWASSAGWYAAAHRSDKNAPYELSAVQFAWESWQAALAARQPGAQVPDAGPYLDEPDAPSNPLWKRLLSIANWLTVLAPNSHMEAAELLLTASARIQRNDAAPHAQGIDPAQFRPWIQGERDRLFSALDRVTWEVHNEQDPNVRKHSEERRASISTKMHEADRLLALIDQRDAAPGVE